MRIRTFGGLWIEGPSGSPALGPRRLALLALVAAAGRRGISRDRLIGILWPDAEEEQARHTLSQTIYTLKRDTGRDWIVAGPELRLDPSISSEVGDLQEALTAGAWETVDDLATGVFLEGFYLAGAPEFERWVEEERARLQSAIARALEQLSVRADEARDHPGAVRWWTRLTELDPLNARYAAGRMRALASAGDRGSALAHARSYEDLVRRELDADVDPAIRKLVASLRAESVPAPVAHPATAAAAPVDVVSGPPAPAASRRGALTYLLPLAAVAVIGGFLISLRDRSSDTPFLAVGTIRTDGPPDSTHTAEVLRDMLATSLGGIQGLQVVANSRLVELMPPGSGASTAVTNDAARRAGASEIVEGELETESAGLVLSLRRVRLSDGVVRKGFVIRAADRYAVVDSAAAAIARDLGFAAPATSVAQVRTSSPAAYALYDEGLRALFGYEAPAAYRLMNAALAHDSTFAMAAFYSWYLARVVELEESVPAMALERVRRLATRTTERERLLIQTSVAGVDAPLPVMAALAETLSVKYPADPDGQLMMGAVRHSQGDFAGAVAAHEMAFRLDSTAGALSGPYCRACFALDGMATAYLWWDSAGAVERTARRLIAVRPNEPVHWRALVEPLLRQGRRPEAEDAAERGGGLRSGLNGWFLRDLLRWGRYEEADRLFVEEAMSLDSSTRSDAVWLLLLSLRDQGRLREADTLTREWRIPGTRLRIPSPGEPAIDLALLGVDRGQPMQTVRVHRDLASRLGRSNTPHALRARGMVWNLVLAGTAYVAAADTVSARRLADSTEAIGRHSHWARDIRLHHMLRGLIHQSAGRHAEAVEAFRQSLYSVTDGYTRTNLMMARSLLALGRGSEAITLLRAAIHGGVDGSNTYVSRTELHEALAQAFEQAGQPDSSRVHYAAVESAWRRADPKFRERYLQAKLKAGL